MHVEGGGLENEYTRRRVMSNSKGERSGHEVKVKHLWGQKAVLLRQGVQTRSSSLVLWVKIC